MLKLFQTKKQRRFSSLFENRGDVNFNIIKSWKGTPHILPFKRWYCSIWIPINAASFQPIPLKIEMIIQNVQVLQGPHDLRPKPKLVQKCIENIWNKSYFLKHVVFENIYRAFTSAFLECTENMWKYKKHFENFYFFKCEGYSKKEHSKVFYSLRQINLFIHLIYRVRSGSFPQVHVYLLK